MFRTKMLALAMVALLLALTAIPSSAQQSIGTILGTVKDSSGAVIPDATVTITSAETGLTRTVTSGADGAFRAPALPVGHYNLRIEKTGFNAEARRGLVLDVAEELVVNSTLAVGAVTQEVEVSGEAPLVNTTSSALGSMVNEERMSDLPLNGRNYVDLTLIQPGVSKQILNTTGGFGSAGTWFSANGAPVRSNNFTIDGAIMVNSLGAATSSEAGTSLGVDGIREYRVVTSAFSAEYGLAMGSQMIMVSKSGSNQWHGDVFEYLRISALDARNFFDYSTATNPRRLPEFQRNNFGGSFGGPIRKDKTFFFGVYEGLRQNLGVTILDSVMPAACHQLVTSSGGVTTLANPSGCDPTGKLTSSTVVPAVIQPWLALYPSPNLPNNQYTFPSASTQREDFGQMRVDHNFSSSDTLFARYTIDDGDLNNATGNNRTVSSGVAFPQFRTLGNSRNQFVTLSENHVFSPSLLNTAKLSFSRTNFGVQGTSTFDPTAPGYSFYNGQPMGSIAISSGLSQMGGLGSYSFHIQNIFTLSDDLFYTKGRHALKFGALINNYNLFNAESKLLYGQLTFNDVPSFMQGIYHDYSALTAGSYLPRFWAYKTVGFYAQDDIRVNSRLTVNAGLRYEFLTIPRARYGLESRFLNFLDPTQTWTYGVVMQNPSLHNFSPRGGFAWDVMGDGKTAVRGGFGIYQEVGNFGAAIDQISLAMPPFSSQSAVTTNPTNAVVPIPFVFGPASLGKRLQTMDYNVQQPHTYQYNFTVDRQLPGGMGLAVSYVGLRGMNLWQIREGNPIPSQTVNGVTGWFPFLCGGVPSAVTCTGAVANPAYQFTNPAYNSSIQTTTKGDSWYNSLQVVLNKRLSHGLEFQSAYTWSKSLDTTQGQLYASDCFDAGSLYGNHPSNTIVDKGPSCFDARQNWHMNVLYHIPNIKSDNLAARFLHGWWVGNIVTVQTGFAVTPLLNTNRSNSGILQGQGTGSIVDPVNLGNTSTSTTFKCTGTASAFPGAPPCSGGTVTYNFIPYNPSTVTTGDPNMWFNPLMFQLPAAGVLGNAGRGILRGPGLGNWDLSINKDTALRFLGEGGKLQFRMEIFNILNHANFFLPSGRVFTGTSTDPAGASEAPIGNVFKITSTATSSRQIQLALKIIF